MGLTNYFPFFPRIFIKSGMPIHFTFFITSKCNSRCKTCFYWKKLNRSKKELSLEEIERVSRSMKELLWLALSGGEPFLRQDIAEIAEIFYENSHVRNLSINTNGIETKRIVEKTDLIAKALSKCFINVNVSLDGIEEMHDEIRGINGCYQKAIKTFHALKNLKKKHHNLGVGISTVFNSMNQDNIDEIFELVSNKLKPDNWDLDLIRGNPKDEKTKRVNIQKFIKIKRKIEREYKKGKLQYYALPLSRFLSAMQIIEGEILYKIASKNSFVIPCYASRLSIVMDEEGNVYPCEILLSAIGNVRDHDYNMGKIIKLKKMSILREKISKNKCFCIHGCNLYINILFNPSLYPRIVLKCLELAD